VVVDGSLVTGQNPASGAAAAEAVLKELAARA
jgi:putative intracellular protease/amidase